MLKTLTRMAEISFQYGLIGIDEFQERLDVVNWIINDTKAIDPRVPKPIENDISEKKSGLKIELRSTVKQNSDSPDWIEFLFDRKWYFTKSDPDSYPSTPHGHLNNPKNAWPKLNPYTGRVFKTKNQEDTSMRLSKPQMKKLWNDHKFRSFCRDYIMWYMEEYSHHTFSVLLPLRFPRW